MKKLFLTMAALALLAACVVSQASVRYTLTDLGTLGGTDTRAWSINDSGEVVGSSKYSPFNSHAFRWAGGVLTDLGTINGPMGSATGINNNGQVVGWASVDSTYQHAFLLNPGGAMVDLGSPGQYSSANAINNLGQVVGSAGSNAFLRQANGAMVDLGMLPGATSSTAYAINNNSQVVGTSGWTAFIWNNGVMTNLGTLGGAKESCATGINDAGIVVGNLVTSTSQSRAFRWQAGAMYDLGSLGGFSYACDIDDNGKIVGSSEISPGGIADAYIWENGVMTDLNTLIEPGSGWRLCEARSINSTGQIVGTARYGDETRAFLLNPVPEPSSILVLCSGAISLAVLKRRRHS